MGKLLSKAMRNDLKALNLAVSGDRKGDFRFTMGQMESIFANARTSGRSAQGQLTATQKRELAAMSRISARGNERSKAASRGGANEARNMFGSAMGGVIDEQFGEARAATKATRTNSRANVAAGGLLAKGGQLALKSQRAGVAEAEAGAEYAMASALSYRAKEDAELIAARRSQLMDAALAEKAAKAEAERDKAYLRLQNQGAGNNSEGFQTVATSLTELAATEGATVEQANALIGAAGYQYNLSPKAKSKLNKMRDELFGKTGSSLAGSATGAPLISMGAQKSLNGLAWKAQSEGTDVSTDAAIMQFLGFVPDGKGGYTQGTNEYDEEFVTATIRFFRDEYARIVARVGVEQPDGRGARPAGDKK